MAKELTFGASQLNACPAPPKEGEGPHLNLIEQAKKHVTRYQL